MSIDVLYPKVTEAIERAEAFEDAGRSAEARAAFFEVSILEEEISESVPGDDVEGALARRGAVRAALKAGVIARARDLAERYLAHGALPGEVAADLRAMYAEASEMLAVDDLIQVRIVPDARYRIHRAA